MNKTTTKPIKNTALAATLGLALGLATVVIGQERTTGEAIDDSGIVAATKMGLMDETAVSAGDINVESYKGEVQLIGFVDSDEAKSAAIAKAKSVKGVDKVSDALIVTDSKRSMGRMVDDQTLHARVKLAVADIAGMGDAVSVIVKVREGEVLLGGYVDQDRDRDAILKAAQGVEGIGRIHNKIGVRM